MTVPFQGRPAALAGRPPALAEYPSTGDEVADGLLVVVAHGALLTKNYSRGFDIRMDPFARITFGGEKVVTKVHRSGGLDPVWNQRLTLGVSRGTVSVIRAEVVHMGTFGDKIVGWCDIDVSPALRGEEMSALYPLTGAQGADREGQIKLTISYEQTTSAYHNPSPGQWRRCDPLLARAHA